MTFLKDLRISPITIDTPTLEYSWSSTEQILYKNVFVAKWVSNSLQAYFNWEKENESNL